MKAVSFDVRSKTVTVSMNLTELCRLNSCVGSDAYRCVKNGWYALMEEDNRIGEQLDSIYNQFSTVLAHNK